MQIQPCRFNCRFIYRAKTHGLIVLCAMRVLFPDTANVYLSKPLITSSDIIVAFFCVAVIQLFVVYPQYGGCGRV